MLRFAIFVAVLLSVPAAAHVVSVSTGDFAIDGTRAHYSLRMPLYEVSHLATPEQTLFDHVKFAGARRVKQTCTADQPHDQLLCEADYEFPAPPARLDVECTLAAVTVPNHVHLLRAQLDGRPDQAVFDMTFPRASLRFRPPTRLEIALEQAGAGWMRALGGAVPLLFLFAVVIAARTRGELLAIGGAFLIGQIAAVMAMPYVGWQPVPRFVEAATALAVAYLAVEILALPREGARWAVTAVLGVFHGVYFHLFIQATNFHAVYVLTGAALAELSVISILAMLYARIRGPRTTPLAAAALLGTALIWFAIRLRG